jgi:hypothetical protein
LDTGAGKNHDADWERREHGIVALEGRGFGVALPIRPEGDLGDFSSVGPACGDEFGAVRLIFNSGGPYAPRKSLILFARAVDFEKM